MGAHSYKDWIADGWIRDGLTYFKTFKTVEEARAFMETQRPSPETQARMNRYKASMSRARVVAAVWEPGKALVWKVE